MVALLIMVLGIAISIYFLYRDVPQEGWFAKNNSQVEEQLNDDENIDGSDSTIIQDSIKNSESSDKEKSEDSLVEEKQTSFEVKNFATGKINTFEQLDDNSLMLIDENGKISWKVDFNEPICGRVLTIDYYANGRLQFLFAAGSKIYLYDRLGRVVSKFPVDLKSEVALGPDVYDFSGSKRYNIIVLHTNNTIQMYNLRGEKPSQWRGIAPKEKILTLPTRLVKNNVTNWIVYTKNKTLVYPFYGGETIKELKGTVELNNINL